MVIGDEDVHAECTGRSDAGDTGDAVVDCHDQRRLASRGERDDLGGEAVTELETIRHEEVDGRETPRAQRAEHECGAGGAVGIEIANDQDAAVLAMLHQQRRGIRDAFECSDGQESIECGSDVRSGLHAARRVDPPQHWMELATQHRVARAVAPHDTQYQFVTQLSPSPALRGRNYTTLRGYWSAVSAGRGMRQSFQGSRVPSVRR